MDIRIWYGVARSIGVCRFGSDVLYAKTKLTVKTKNVYTISSQKSNLTFKLRCVKINVLDFIIYCLCCRLLG